MSDPTYDKNEIEMRLNWKIAFMMSEMLNDNAPIGWGLYIPAADKAIDMIEEKFDPRDY